MSKLMPSVVLIVAMMIGIGAAHAQPYPAKPIRLIVPLQPGGLADGLARLLSQPHATSHQKRAKSSVSHS